MLLAHSAHAPSSELARIGRIGGSGELHGKSLTRLLPCSNPAIGQTAPHVPRRDMTIDLSEICLAVRGVGVRKFDRAASGGGQLPPLLGWHPLSGKPAPAGPTAGGDGGFGPGPVLHP